MIKNYQNDQKLSMARIEQKGQQNDQKWPRSIKKRPKTDQKYSKLSSNQSKQEKF